MRLSRSLLSAFALATLLTLPLGISARTIGNGVQKQLDRLPSSATSLLDERSDNGWHLGQLKHQDRDNDNDHAEDPTTHVNFTGTITAIAGDQLTVKRSDGTSVDVGTQDAKFVSVLGVSLTLADFRVNDQVRVVGTKDEGGIEARLVQKLVASPAPAERFAGSGTVISLDPQAQTFVLKTVWQGSPTIHVGSDTRITKNGVMATFADIALQSQAQVVGTWDTDHARVHATEIRLRVLSAPVQAYVTGDVTAVSTSSLTLVVDNDAKSPYTIRTEQALILSQSFMRFVLGDIRVGDTLRVWGTTSSDSPSTLQARLIIDTSRPLTDVRIVTMADTSSTLRLGVGDRLRLELGSGYTWSVQTSDTAVLTRVADPTSTTQGVYQAKAVGSATLTATGTPACSTSTPPCAMPSVSFSLKVEVVAQQ